MLDLLIDKWHRAFGVDSPDVVIRAPGRVNIIGEHTDYNEGWVLPGAMSRAIYLLVSKNENNNHHWIAYDLDEEFQSEGPVSASHPNPSWVEYIEGALKLYDGETGSLKMIIGGDLPVGAGISSSSALVCGMLCALQELNGRKEAKEELAILGSRVEREIIGLQGGIMDQFAIMLSLPDHVMLLDCRSRTYRHIPVELPGCKWILINTKVKHQLLDSDYNRRAAECNHAVNMIQSSFPYVKSLRDVTMDMLLSVNLPEPYLRRSLFVLQENDRVHQMVEALRDNHPKKAGELLKASHDGLRYQYEVSCEELDHLADFANTYTGILGARMMGGGFGGCVICLLQEGVLDTFVAECISSYSARFGFEPEVIYFELGPGVGKVSL